MFLKVVFVHCLKKMPTLVNNSSVKNIRADDFALRKRFSYGTVMVDLDSHRIIDMIPTKNTEEVKNWLAEYPNIEVISRDGAPIYTSTAKKSHPEVIQVSDRFHIIKGMTDAVTRYLIREFPARIEIPAVLVNSDEIKRLQNINNRSERVAFAHQKHKEGLTVNEIALLLHSTPKTVQKYLKLEPSEIVDRIILKEKNIVSA